MVARKYHSGHDRLVLPCSDRTSPTAPNSLRKAKNRVWRRDPREPDSQASVRATALFVLAKLPRLLTRAEQIRRPQRKSHTRREARHLQERRSASGSQELRRYPSVQRTQQQPKARMPECTRCGTYANSRRRAICPNKPWTKNIAKAFFQRPSFWCCSKKSIPVTALIGICTS